MVQTHGRSGHYNPHLHIIMTNGGIDIETGKWVDLGYFPYEVIHKKWQYHLFGLIKSFFGTVEIKELVDEIVRLSTEFGILTEYTAFLADEDRAIPVTEAQERAASSMEAMSAPGAGYGGAGQARSQNAQAMQQQKGVYATNT